jgi:predicted DNA-binding transcriptional regulator AlpA
MKRTAKEKTHLEQVSQTVLYSAADCARMCGLSRRTWFRLASSARTPACVRVGASPRWVRKTLEHWIALGCPDRRTFEARLEAEDAS